jgi:hypothetical protein
VNGQESGVTVIWQRRWSVLAIAVMSYAVMPLIGIGLFWIGLRLILRVLGQAPDPSNFTAPWSDILNAIYLGFGPATFFIGLAIGAQRVLVERVSLGFGAGAGLFCGLINLAAMMTLWPDRDPPELPYRLMELNALFAYAYCGILMVLLVRLIARSQFQRAKL